MDAPRDDLVRMVSRASAQVETDGNLLFGYPIVFNERTVINSWEGQFEEVIAPGALTKTLRENRDQVKVLFNHGMDPTIGDKPLGKPSKMRADATGLYVEVPLSDTSYNEDIRALLRDGALDGMSFRFSVVKETWDEPKRKGQLPLRTIQELRLFEFGPVTFPAYDATLVGIRSREPFAEWLRFDEDKRAQLRTIFGIEDLGTPSSTDERAASDDTADEPDQTATPKHNLKMKLQARDIAKRAEKIGNKSNG